MQNQKGKAGILTFKPVFKKKPLNYKNGLNT